MTFHSFTLQLVLRKTVGVAIQLVLYIIMTIQSGGKKHLIEKYWSGENVEKMTFRVQPPPPPPPPPKKRKEKKDEEKKEKRKEEK